MKLSQFFQEPYIEQALDAYLAARPNWDIGTKIDLYRHADTAFGYDQPEYERRQAFYAIYNSLKSYWKVFRKAQNYWDADTTFSALDTLRLSRRDSGTDLISLSAGTHSAGILRELLSLRDLKKNQSYPYMAVSKFLHFANPGLYPIFDTDAIWNTVCNGVFKPDYCNFCSHHQLKPSETSGRFNLNYTLWASELLQGADPKFMAVFTEWMMRRIPHAKKSDDLAIKLPSYYATAFEFVAIGAADWIRTS